jgi:hypothetical protein
MYINEFIIPIYLYLAILVAFLGRKTKLKFFKSLVLSLIITPLLSLIILILFYPAKVKSTTKNIKNENM